MNEKLKRLTQKQEAFCLAYLETSNASQAYCKAYSAEKMKPESIRVNAAKLLTDTNIALRVKDLREKAALVAILVAADVLVEIKRLAFSDLRGVMKENGTIKMPHELDAATAAAISSFEMNEQGGIKYKFWDKNVALEKAAKHLGLYELDNKQRAAEFTSPAALQVFADRMTASRERQRVMLEERRQLGMTGD